MRQLLLGESNTYNSIIEKIGYLYVYCSLICRSFVEDIVNVINLMSRGVGHIGFGADSMGVRACCFVSGCYLLNQWMDLTKLALIHCWEG